MSVNDWLTVALVWAAVVRRHWLPLTAVILYSAHMIFDPRMSATVYYGSAAIVDCAICGLCYYCNDAETRHAAVRIAKCSFALVVANVVGWLLWFLYAPPTIYNWAVSAVYAYMIFAFLDKGPSNGFRRSNSRSGARANPHSRRPVVVLRGGKL